MRKLLAASLLLTLACGGDDRPMTTEDSGPADGGVDAGPMGIALLGFGAHTTDAVDVQVVATSEDAVGSARDLEFNPSDPSQLWVVNYEGTVTILTDVGTPEQDWRRRSGPGGDHFFSQPSALAFGIPGVLASAPEQDSVTQPSTPADFMGPTLWSADLAIFDAGHAGHLDMLHNSPNSTGIAWEQGNAYWIFDGSHSSLTRYDFNDDHGPGGADHSDGVVRRYAEGEVSRAPGVSSHMEVSEGFLYVADSGNGRIARLDVNSGTPSAIIGPNYDGTLQQSMDGAVVETLVAAGSVEGLVVPSGLTLRDGMIFVSDYETSRIFAFELDGTLVDWLDLSAMVAPGSLMGIAFDPSGNLFVADYLGQSILRVAAL